VADSTYSLRGSIDVDFLERYSAEDYSTVSDKLTDSAIITAGINPAEMAYESKVSNETNGNYQLTLKASDSTHPNYNAADLPEDYQQYGVAALAKKYLDNWIIEQGLDPENQDRIYHDPQKEEEWWSVDVMDHVRRDTGVQGTNKRMWIF
jgi:hypothetical protein